MICFRAKPAFRMPIMGYLPNSAVISARTFSNVGCDFAGHMVR